MGFFDNAVPGGNITKPLMIALGALLVGKMLSGRSAEQADEPAAQPQTPAPTGTTASGDGGLLGGLGGLLDKLKDAGHGNVADSWVGTGRTSRSTPMILAGRSALKSSARSRKGPGSTSRNCSSNCPPPCPALSTG